MLLLCSNIFIYFYMKKQYASTQEMKKIGSPCFDSFPNQYSSLPTRENKPNVKRQSSFNSTSGVSSKLLPNSHGTLSKSNNISGHHTPKVLSKCFVEFDTVSVKRNGPSNIRTMRTIDDDKF